MALRAVPDHPKFAGLKTRLSLNKAEAMGYLECVWHFCGRFTPQGNIGKYSDAQIESWVEWRGDAGVLIGALTAEGWLDANETHRLVVHDWHLHADKATKNALVRSKQSFAIQPSVECTDAVRTPYRLPVPEPEPEPVPAPEPVKATPLSDKSATPQPRPEEFANCWNRFRGSLSKVSEFTDSRRKKVQTRMRQGVTLEQFERAVKHCAVTPFLQGENDRGWKADFDWLIENDKNLLRVMEGKFDGTSRRSGEGTRGAAVGRVERSQSAFRQAALASIKDAGGFDAGSDGGGLALTGAAPGHGEDVPTRSGDAGGGVWPATSAVGVGIVSDAAEVLPPSERDQRGSGDYGREIQ